MSSELRLNTAMEPSSSLCTWARSPSYLYSHVNFLPSNLSSTSPMALVGFASMGLSGTPGVSLHSSRSRSMPTLNSAGITTSYEGSSLAAQLSDLASCRVVRTRITCTLA